MSGPSALWLYAHRALSPQFHDDPAAFVAALDGAAAPVYLEKLWAWAKSKGQGDAPADPPLVYGIDRRAGRTIVWMELSQVTRTGEPWQIRFVESSGFAGPRSAAEGRRGAEIVAARARMFLLEHSEYATERDGKPTAIVCESEPGGRHVNWGLTLAPDDAGGFDAFVLAQVADA